MQLSCPTADRLREFLEGSVDDAEANQISDHVVECPSCDRVICTLESEQSEVSQRLREGLAVDRLLDEPEFEQLRNTARLGQADTTAPSDVDEHPETGKRLRDYRLVKKIGEGGMGTVYQAVHVHLAKHVALKILPADKLRSRQAVRRFRQEMRAVGKVNHPNVVSASDAGTVDGQHFLVMELVQGADLARIIHDRGPLKVADACEIVRQAAIGLQHAHDNGLVHRDVKPSNIMLALDGSVKLLDLGLAGLNNTEFESTANVVVTDRLTSVGQIMGTLDYMAPEQITASPRVDSKADIYALGATLFQLLTGRTPCGDRSEGTPERIEAVLHKPPLDIRAFRDDVPEELCSLLLKMLAKNPEDRPQLAIDVAGELERFTSDADLVALAEACRTSLDMPSADVDVTDDVSFVVSRTAPTQDHGSPRRPFTAVALGGLFLALVAAVIYYIQTNNGVVRVEVTDPSLKVAISDQTITMNEGNKKPLTIRAGEQSLVVRQGDSDFEFETDRFQIRRGDKIAFKVELLSGEVVVSKDGEKFAAKSLTNGDKTHRIAFGVDHRRQNGIHVIHTDGSGLRQLTNDPFGFSPSWSPDGQQIAFLTLRAEDHELNAAHDLAGHFFLYVMNADGRNQRRVTKTPIGSIFQWSPDGQKFLFQSSWEDSSNKGKDGLHSSAIYVMKSDGSQQQRLTPIEKSDSFPTWSPDGKRIAFCSDRGGTPDIYVMNADGSGVRQLTDDEAGDTDPVWSPDGSQIAFTSFRKHPGGSVCLVRADGSDEKLICDKGWAVGWSPDSRRILITKDGQLATVDAVGQREIWWTKPGIRALDAAFTSDGKNIFYRTKGSDGWEIRSVSVNGGQPERIIGDVGDITGFSLWTQRAKGNTDDDIGNGEGIKSRRPDEQENTKDELRKLLERSPHLREKLAQEAEESGNLELAKWLRSDLPVDDGQDSLALANLLAEKEDWVAATDAYLAAYRSDPNLYSDRHVQAFRKAGRLTELAAFFDETMLLKLDNDKLMENLVLTLLREKKTQAVGYDLLERVFQYNHYTARLLLQKYDDWGFWKDLPNPVSYLRRVLLPTDFEQPGWQRLSVSSVNYNQVSVSGSLTLARPLYHDRETLRQFATEIRELIEQHPKWVGGWALLAFIEAESGNSREAVNVLRKRFLDADSDEIPPSAAWLLGECLEGKDEELDRVVIELLEPCVRKIATLTYKRTPGTFGPYDQQSLRVSPIKTLARLYAKYDRRQEARQLLYGLTYSTNQHPLVEGYAGNAIGSCLNGQRCLACHRVDRGDSNFRSYYDFTEMTDAMTDIGYPVDSLISLARMDKSYGHAFDSSRGWIDTRSEFGAHMEKFDLLYKSLCEGFGEQKAKAERAVTPRLVIEALELDTFQRSLRFDESSLSNALEVMKSSEGDAGKTKAMRELARTSQGRENKGKVVLELMLSVRGEGPDANARVFSPVVDILKLAVQSKETAAAKDIAELDKRLVTLSEQHPKSIEAGIVATVFAFLRNDLDSAKDRLKRLQAITDYPEPDGAAFWLVARHALQHDQTRIIGAVLAERALAAASAQPDSRLKDAIVRERSGVGLRKLLKRDPQLREKLTQEAEESGNSELAEWIRSDLPVDDGQDSLALPTRLAENEDWDAACDAFLAAYEANPDLFDFGHHLKAFREAGRMIELAQCFDEKKLRKMKEPAMFGDPDPADMMLRLAGELIRNTKTRPNGYELLKRVMKSQRRARDRVFRYHHFRWEDVPEPAYYLRTLFIPEDFTSEGDGWWRLSVGALPDHFGTVGGLLKDTESLYRDRIALGKLAGEIRVLADENPTWAAGWALLAFIESKAGNHREAARVLRERFVDSDIEKMHCHAAWMIGICLAGQNSDLDKVVIQLLEYSLRKLITGDFKRPVRLYRTSSGKVSMPQYGPLPGAPLRRWPIKDLARLYAEHGRRLEARQLLYGLVDPIDQHPLVEGYFPGTYNGGCGNRGSCIACHRGEKIFFDFVAKTDAMTDVGYPVDSLLSLARIDASFRNAFSSSRGWIDSSTEEGKRFNETDLSGKYQALYYFNEQQAKAQKALTPRMVIEALELDTFRRWPRIDSHRFGTALELMKSFEGDDEKTKAMRELARTSQGRENKGKVVLDLMLSVRGEGPDAKATVFSPVVDILKLAVESKESNAAKDIAELDKRLVTLSEQHPKSIEAGIVATVFAFLRNDLDSAKDRLKRLQAITDYPESDGAAFWLVARHALQHDQTRIIGAVLAERALTTAETQPDSRLKEAILRERSRVRSK